MANNTPSHICSICGYAGKPITHTPGSIVIELILWILFIIPGVIYSVWRLTARQQVCPKCKNPNMMPVDTPKGQEMLHNKTAKGY